MKQTGLTENIRTILKIIPKSKLVFSAGTIFCSVGIARFWELPIHWLEIGLVVLLCWIGISTAFLLQLQIYRRQSTQHTLTFLSEPWGKINNLGDLQPQKQINLIIYFLFFLIPVLYLMILRNLPRTSEINFVFLIYIAMILMNAFSGSSAAVGWFEEISDGILTILMPSTFAYLVIRPGSPLVHTLAYATPLFFGFLAFRFIQCLAAYDQQVSFQPGAYPTLIRKGEFRFHHVIVGSIFLSLILFNQLGVHWRLLAPQLVLIPTWTYQIVLIEKIMKGMAPNWKLLGWLSLANLLLSLYLFLLPVWIWHF
jgi:hypothetical protein